VKDQHLYSGIVEDILLQHEELTNASLFQISDQFVAPQISAPEVYKEMLYSLLQKNFQKDLSGLQFDFKDNTWIISNGSVHYQCESFEEMIKIVTIIH